MEHMHEQYTCPMHPEVIKDAPGKCPKCGMELVPLTTPNDPHAGHKGEQAQQADQDMTSMQGHGDKHSGHGGGHAHHAGMIEDFKKRFYVVLALTIPIMALSPP